MSATLTPGEQAQLAQTIEMFEVITQSQPNDYQSLEILKEAYAKLGRQNDVVTVSKRIANAYVLLGQISSAILEYESILQQAPNDADVVKALKEIESRAGKMGSTLANEPLDRNTPVISGFSPSVGASGASFRRPAAPTGPVDDGKQWMQKLFVEPKLVSPTDFEACWPKVDYSAPPAAVVEPFLLTIHDKQLYPLDKSLKLLSEKSRLGYLPIERYDVDVEFVRTFSKEVCRRWAVLPFDRMSKSILVATANPFNKQAAKDLEALAKGRILWYIASPTEIVKAVKKIFR